jgi:hypothetical protein
LNVGLKAAAFTVSNEKTNLKITQRQSGIGGNSIETNKSFYYDTVSSPTVTSFALTLTNPATISVSGIRIIYGSVAVTANTVAENVGKYFYNKDNILTYMPSGSESGLTNITAGKTVTFLNSSVTFSNNSLTYSSSNFATSISMSVRAYNPIGIASSAVSSAPVSAIYDHPSYVVFNDTNKYKATIQLVGNGLENIIGCRIWSGVSAGNTPLRVTALPPAYSAQSIIYDNIWNITSVNNGIVSGVTIDATEELQFANGAYRSKGTGTTSYLNYSTYLNNTLNYSTISGTGYRFATFCWKYNQRNDPYTLLSFAVNGISATVLTPNATPTVAGQPLYFYYRIEDKDSFATFQAGNATSLWVDANSLQNTLAGANYFVLTQPAYVGGRVLGGKNAALSNTFADGTLTMNVNQAKNVFNVATGKNIYLYLRVALPMSVDVDFTHITCSMIP